MSDRVVLAREAADEQIDIRNDGSTASSLLLISIEDDGYVLVGCNVLDKPEVRTLSGLGIEVSSVALEVAGADMPFVCIEGVLGLSRRLPLIAPDHVETGASSARWKPPTPANSSAAAGRRPVSPSVAASYSVMRILRGMAAGETAG